MLPLIALTTTGTIGAPSQEARQAILDEPADREGFERCLAAWPHLFDRIEVTAPNVPQPAPDGPVKIVFWNAERCKHLEPSTRLLGGIGAAAHLLVELDVGMARSGQRHTARDLARHLATGCVFAVEFLELGLGDAKERQWHAGEVNRLGLHGAAILSGHRLRRPAVVRLETEGGWFDGRRAERRLGGRIAVLATLPVAGVPVTLAAVHLESHSDPAGRATQTGVLLDAIDAYAPDQPVLIGGDFNTCTIDRDWARGSGQKPALDPARLLDPIGYEPLFEVIAARGYDFRDCNTLGVATQRTRPDGTPPPPLGRLDWFFTRGLAAANPATVPAIDEAGRAISDHEVLTVSVWPTDRTR